MSAGETVRCYRTQGRKFLVLCPQPLAQSLAGVDAAAVTGYVLEHVGRREQRVVGEGAGDRAAQPAAVPARPRLDRLAAGWGGACVAGWRLASLAEVLPPAQVRGVCWPLTTSTPGSGCVITPCWSSLARLGLRGAEVAAMRLADVEWRAGQLVVRGKRLARRTAAAAGRGRSGAGRLRDRGSAAAVSARACSSPPGGRSGRSRPGAVRAIMGRACGRAGLPRLGAHRLRHTLATDLLRAGASLPRSGRCCVTAASCPPRSTPRSTTPRCGRWRGRGQAVRDDARSASTPSSTWRCAARSDSS